MENYTIKTFWSDKDQTWIGICPEFEGLATVGKTRREAADEAEAALANYIEIYKEDGIPLPKPLAVSEYSGQVRLRMSRFAHERAVLSAEAEGISLNTFLSGAVEARLAISDYQQALLDQWAALWEKQVATTVITPAPYENNLTVDAAKVNPKPKRSKK